MKKGGGLQTGGKLGVTDNRGMGQNSCTQQNILFSRSGSDKREELMGGGTKELYEGVRNGGTVGKAEVLYQQSRKHDWGKKQKEVKRS